MTDEHPFITDATIVAYLDGVSSPEDAARIELAVAQDLQFAEVLEGMRRILEVSARYPEWDTEQLWKVFAESTGLGKEFPMKSPAQNYGVPVKLTHRSDAEYSDRQLGTGPQTFRIARQNEGVFSGRTLPPSVGQIRATLRTGIRRRNAWHSTSAWLGAAVLLGMAVGARYLWPPQRQSTSTHWTTYATANGQRARITLPDGTVVVLNVASQLEIPEHFGYSGRTVRLHGEAVFHVAHTTGAPFTVDAAGTHARVLGTEFDVRAYQPTDVQVAVRSGRVMVDSTVLAANDIAHLTAMGHLLVARQQQLDAAFGFVTGRLILADLPLRDAIVQMDRWYDVDIRLADSTLGGLPVDAVLLNASVSDLRQTLQTALNIRTVLHGRTLTLYAR